MGSSFSYNLLRDRVSNSLNIGISILNQCKSTLDSEFECQNCPNLLINGISFERTPVITLDCLNNSSLISQIRNRINEYLLIKAQQDQSLGFSTDEFSKYITLTQNLSIIITQDLINLSNSYIKDQGLYCTISSRKEFFVIANRLNSYLINNVPKSMTNTTTFKDLVNLLNSTKISQNKDKDVAIFGIVFLILFLIALALLLIGIPCGYIIILIVVIFIISIIVVRLTN